MASNRWANAGLVAAMAALCLAVPAGAQDASVGASQSSGASANSGRSASTGSGKSTGTSMSDGISIGVGGLDRAGEALARAGEALGQVERLEPQVNVALERLPETLAPLENLATPSGFASFSEFAMSGDDRDQEKAERESELYDDGQDAIDENKWDKAIEKFDQVIELHGRHVDAAIYWKAYAQNRQGHRTDALATIATLKKDYPQSHWVNEAQALDLEIHQTESCPQARR